MIVDLVRQFSNERKQTFLILLLLPLLVVAFTWAIIFFPFPQNLAFLFSLPLLIVICCNMQAGIIIWFVLSTVGNMFEVDLPGIPPLRTAHMILLMLLGVWIMQSYKEIPPAIARFLSTGKNRVLLLLLGWITLSMVMGRLTGVTQKSYEYQFNGWMSVVLAIALALFVSNYLNERLLKSIIFTSVILGTILTAAVLVSGFLRGLGLSEWKTYYYEFVGTTELIMVSPFFLAILYFPEQKWWGKFLFAVAIILSTTLNVLLILGGSRSHLLSFVTLIIILFIKKAKLLISSFILIVIPIFFFNFSVIQPMLDEQIGYTIDERRVISGKGDRIALAQDAIRIIKEHPLWGTGSDSYRQHSSVYFLDQETKMLIPAMSAHNTWLSAAVNHGIIGSILLAFFFYFVLKDAYYLYRLLEDGLFKKFTLLFLATFSTLILGSPFGESILPPFTMNETGEARVVAPYLLGFWLEYGIILGIGRFQRRQQKGPNGQRVYL